MIKKPEKPEQEKRPVLPEEDVLVEDNRFTPYGALSEKDPGHSIQGAPLKTRE